MGFTVVEPLYFEELALTVTNVYVTFNPNYRVVTFNPKYRVATASGTMFSSKYTWIKEANFFGVRGAPRPIFTLKIEVESAFNVPDGDEDVLLYQKLKSHPFLRGKTFIDFPPRCVSLAER